MILTKLQGPSLRNRSFIHPAQQSQQEGRTWPQILGERIEIRACATFKPLFQVRELPHHAAATTHDLHQETCATPPSFMSPACCAAEGDQPILQDGD